MIAFSFFEILWTLIIATRWTIVLSAIALIGGGILGGLLLVLRLAAATLLNYMVASVIVCVQGTPLIIQLFLMFFGVAALGFNVSAWVAATLTLIIWTGAFLGDIWRGCVEAVARGQWEASASLGMGWLQQLRHVIFPQAIRIAIPATVGFSVQVIKATALTSIIGFIDLTRTASFVANATYKPLLTYGLVAIIYFLLCWPLSLSAAHLSRKLNVANRTS
ncbi:amino-acid ABC transporter permease protein [Rhizobium freirei PRF 81]|uniref:Amino-acid ABC transporter permease protein n=1 Tax=Rhizobium freirei PRF 81 TaxID=363754 RepID=N6U743_9HYPH|nr:ABC transporter permease subunit [Rhizobium freirei]ENN88409.1 amino-acid ABC transporter permease protein [Rhizobium freirei PRF 81]